MMNRSDLLERRFMILNTIAENLKRQSKDDFKGRQFEASPRKSLRHAPFESFW